MNALTVSTEEKEAMMARAQVAIKERLTRMSEQDWTRVYAVLEAAENRLTGSWEVVHRSRDGITCVHKTGLKVMLSGIREDDGQLWMHLSVSRERVVPNWEQLATVKALFLGDELMAVQVFPRRADHINIHRFCLHLWCCLDADPVPDFSSGTGTI